MATKEENIQRLRELATRLGRDPDVSGSAAELSQRVMEWEEEAEAEAEHLPAVENDSDESIVPPGIGQRSERVLIRALRTLHICAIDRTVTGNWIWLWRETRRVFRNTMWTS